MKNKIFCLCLALCFCYGIYAQVIWDEPVKLAECKGISWSQSSVVIFDKVYHVWAESDEIETSIYIQINSSSGDSLQRINFNSGTDNEISQIYPYVIATTDNCLIINWIEVSSTGHFKYKAQKLNVNGAALWNENGITLSEGDNISNQFNYSGEPLMSDAEGGAYIICNNLNPFTIIRVNGNGSIIWQEQIQGIPYCSYKLTPAYPNGISVFFKYLQNDEGYISVNRFSNAGESTYSGLIKIPQANTYDEFDFHAYPDNSFLLYAYYSAYSPQKFSSQCDSLWSNSELKNNKIVFINDNDFFGIENTTEGIIFTKYNELGNELSSFVTIYNSYYLNASINPNNDLVIFYYVWTNILETKIQILKSDNSFQFEEGIDLSLYTGIYSKILFTSEKIILTFKDYSLKQCLVDYTGTNIRTTVMSLSGPYFSPLDELNNQRYHFFPSEDNLSLILEDHYIVMYMIDSSGQKLMPLTGKQILPQSPYNSSGIVLAKTPQNTYVVCLKDYSHTYSTLNLSETGDINFDYNTDVCFTNFFNRTNDILALSAPSDNYRPDKIRKLTSDNTFSDPVDIPNTGMLDSYDLQFPLIFERYWEHDTSSHYLQLLSEDLVFSSPIEFMHTRFSHGIKTQSISAGLFLSGSSSYEFQNVLYFQLIRNTDNSLLLPLDKCLMKSSLKLKDYTVIAFENNNIYSLYLDTNEGASSLKLQKYTISDNSFEPQYGVKGLTLADDVCNYTAEKIGNYIAISYVINGNYPPNLLQFMCLNNETNSLSTSMLLGDSSTQKPQICPINENNAYVVWNNYVNYPHTNCNSLLVQKLNLSQMTGATIPPSPLILFQNYPNPFNPETNISFALPQAGMVKLEIYNIKGQKVTTLADQYLESGQHNLKWNGTNSNHNNVSCGVYFYKLTTQTKSITKKMLLLK